MENTAVFMENFETESRKVEFGICDCDTCDCEMSDFVEVADVYIIDPLDKTNDLPF